MIRKGSLNHEAGVAPIKKEYSITVSVASHAFRYVMEREKTQPNGSTEKHRGQNHNRTKMNRSGASRNSLGGFCPTLAQGRQCDSGETCRYHHDQSVFLTTRPPDIGDSCPNYVASGYCRFGSLCRFASGHPPEMQHPPTISDGSSTLLTRFRKKELSFEGTEAFIRRLKEQDLRVADDCYPFGEKGKKVDFCNKLYLAPLATVGNLPFRRICKEFGVDITCGEMAMSANILKGQASEWALLKRHESEDVFGVQICGGWADSMTQAAELLNNYVDCDFVDLNMGCPIDMIYRKGLGSGLMNNANRLKHILTGMRTVLKEKPLTVKMRIGIEDGKPLVGKLLPIFATAKINALTIHGRTRQQRYTREADWEYISNVVEMASSSEIPVIGNGDILSFEDYERRKSQTGVQSVMIARGALIKPWIFTEIKERRYWDIRSSERFEILKRYVRYGLEHFGSDTAGVERTRRFLLEWMSFLCRYVPIGLLEVLPPNLNHRPPSYFGRDDLETMMASPAVVDWIKISEMFLGPVPEDFIFVPKHKSNSY